MNKTQNSVFKLVLSSRLARAQNISNNATQFSSVAISWIFVTHAIVRGTKKSRTFKSYLIFLNLANSKVTGLGVGKVEPRDRGGRSHRQRFGQSDSGFRLDIHGLPHGPFLSVVRLGGISRCRADSVVLNLEQVLRCQRLRLGVAPELGAD